MGGIFRQFHRMSRCPQCARQTGPQIHVLGNHQNPAAHRLAVPLAGTLLVRANLPVTPQ